MPSIFGTPNGETLNGTNSADVIDAGDGADTVYGLAGDDLLLGGGGDDVIEGGAGADRLYGEFGDDHLDGGDGDDLLVGGDGDDVLIGGAGNDTFHVGGSTTERGNPTLDGGAGDDIFIVELGQGGARVVTASGGDGDDVLNVSGDGVVRFDGGAGADRVNLINAHGVTVTLGSGRDVVSFAPAPYGGANTPGVVVITDFEAGAGGDRLDLTALLDTMLVGWDHVANPFGLGYLRLVGSGGSAVLQINASGAGWQDLVLFQNVSPGQLTAENLGGYPADGSVPPGLWLTGDDGADTLVGWRSSDRIQGGLGVDTLSGDAGDDVLEGGAGDDVLDGGDGADRLIGGTGDDVLRGGSGADVFVYVRGDGRDEIQGFNPAEDRIEIVDYASVLRIEEAVGGVRVVLSDRDAILVYGMKVSDLTPDCFIFRPGPALPSPPVAPPTAGIPASNFIQVTQAHRVGAGQVLNFTNAVNLGFYLTGGVETSLVNAGTIVVTSTTSDRTIGVRDESTRVATQTATTFVNEASGVLRVTGLDEVFGFQGTFRGGDVQNAGLIEAVAREGDAFGVSAAGMFSDFGNTGTVRAWARDHATGVNFGGHAFSNSGVIEAYAKDAVGVTLVGTGYSFRNTGTIRAVDDTNALDSVAVLILQDSAARIVHYNSGLIQGDYAFRVQENPQMPGGKDVIDNVGQIRGIISLGGNDDEVINAGSIEGRIELGLGADLYDGRSGTQTGGIYGDDGDDVVYGGAGAETIYGEQGDDVIFGGGGDDYIEGGQGADILDGGAGFDTVSYVSALGAVTVDLAAGTALAGAQDTISGFERVVGGAYGDTLIGSAAAETLEGRAGDDQLFGGGGKDTLIGGTGADVLTGGLGDDTFVFAAGDGADVITDFTAGGAEDRLQIYGYDSYLELRQVGADTLVVLSATDSVLLKNVQASALTAADFQFSPGAAPVVPEGAPPPPRIGSSMVTLYAHGEVYAGEFLDLTGRTTGILTRGGDFTNAGLVKVANDGMVLGFMHYPLTPFSAGQKFVNAATGVFQVSASGPNAYALGFGGLQMVMPLKNAGLFDVASAGIAIGVETWWDIPLENTGVFRVTGAGEASGAILHNGGVFLNSGLFEVAGGASGALGLYAGTTLSFVNSGTFRVTGDGGVAVMLGPVTGYEAVLTNSGTIEADYAVVVVRGDNVADPVTTEHLNNSGVIRGRVDLGLGDDRILNTGEMVGRIDLGGGDDLYDGVLGRQTGGVHGGAGVDVLLGGAQADELYGDEGDDVLGGGGGDNLLDGGAGLDLADYSAAASALTVDLGTGRFVNGTGTDTFVSIEGLIGGRFGDTLLGGAGDDRLIGGKGDDVLTGRGGADVFAFSLGDGHDVVTDFQVGVDVLDFSGPYGFEGYLELRQQGADTLVVLSGGDSVLLKGVQAASLTSSSFRFLTATTPRVLNGTNGGDLLVGRDGDDTLSGYDGDDDLRGGAGVDHLNGGAGNDILTGGLGVDWLDGGDGDDTINFADADGWVGVDLRDWGRSGNHSDLGWDWNISVENAIGSRFNDWVTGSAVANFIDGGAGNDSLRGNEGDDRLRGGAGDDLIDGGDGVDTADYADAASGVTVDLRLTDAQDTGGAGIDTLVSIEALVGSSYADTLRGDAGVNRLSGGAGDDVLEGGDGDDLLDGGAGNDRLDGGAGIDTATYAGAGAGVTVDLRTTVAQATGGSGRDTLVGVENLTGSAFDDRLTGDAKSNILVGGSGDDSLDGGAGADRLDGGDGVDTASYVSAAAAVTLNLTTGVHTGDAAGDTFISIERFLLSGRDDQFTGSAGTDNVNGYYGNDTLFGAGGDDVLDGGAGNDILRGGLGADRLIGGDGVDQANYQLAKGSVTLNLTTGVHTGEAAGDTFDSIERFVLTGYGDQFTGSAGADEAVGYYGNDILFGAGGDDKLDGGNGNDILRGGEGADQLVGGTGTDTASYQIATAAVTLNLTTGVHTGEAAGDTFDSIERYALSTLNDSFIGSAGADWVDGWKGNDVLYGQGGADEMFGNEGNDQLYGGTGNDKLHGDGGADILYGDAGSDILYGGTGADQLFGGDDGDYLWGEAGNDVLTGGAGADRFAFSYGSGVDIITDFQRGQDKIILKGMVGIDDFSDLRISADVHGWAVITWGDGTSSVTLNGVAAGQVTASDIWFT